MASMLDYSFEVRGQALIIKIPYGEIHINRRGLETALEMLEANKDKHSPEAYEHQKQIYIEARNYLDTYGLLPEDTP